MKKTPNMAQIAEIIRNQLAYAIWIKSKYEWYEFIRTPPSIVHVAFALLGNIIKKTATVTKGKGIQFRVFFMKYASIPKFKSHTLRPATQNRQAHTKLQNYHSTKKGTVPNKITSREAVMQLRLRLDNDINGDRLLPEALLAQNPLQFCNRKGFRWHAWRDSNPRPSA